MLEVCGKEISVSGRLIRLARLDGDGFLFLDDDPQPFIAALRDCGSRIDIFSFVQRPPYTSPRHDYPMEWDNFAALEITTFDDWWNQQIGFKARNKAKQAAKKGVILEELPFSDELARGIWEIYSESPVRQGRRFPHYGKDFESVRRETATYLAQSIFIGAFLEGKLIGFVKLVVDDTNTQASTMNIISMIKHRDKAPTNALFAEAVRSCARRNIRYLLYSHFSYGNETRTGISDFKERNGMRQIDVPRYYVPLTLAGEIALRLGFHKQLRDRLPGPLLAKFRELRTAWYRRQLSQASEA
jgi:hypothetical protein